METWQNYLFSYILILLERCVTVSSRYRRSPVLRFQIRLNPFRCQLSQSKRLQSQFNISSNKEKLRKGIHVLTQHHCTENRTYTILVFFSNIPINAFNLSNIVLYRISYIFYYASVLLSCTARNYNRKTFAGNQRNIYRPKQIRWKSQTS